MPTYEAGSWFDATIASIADQDYPKLSVTVVHEPGEAPILETHRRRLPELTLVEARAGSGFGEKVTAALEDATEPLVLVCHDDVRFEPGAISALVKERLRRAEDRVVIAPKLVDWNERAQLMPGAFDADRFGATVSLSRPGDLDQGQHDRAGEVFGAGTPALLLDRKGLERIGGFDPTIDWHGEAHDICLRMRLAGARVVIASESVVAHRASWSDRRGPGETFRLRRHQMRSAFAAATGLETLRLIISFAVLHVLEAVVALVRLDLGDLVSIPAAWLWNIRHVPSLLERRRTMRSVRTIGAEELAFVRRRGSIRVSESLDRRITNREDASARGERTVSATRVAGGGVVAALIAFGGRHLLTRGIPNIGEFRAIPDDVGTFTSSWWSSLRTGGMGSEGFATFAWPLLDLLGIAMLGSAGLLRGLLILGLLPLGVVGAWRLFNRSASDKAPVACAALYAASPLPYNAISGGSWQALVLYAAAPWVLASVIGLVQSPSFGLSRPRGVSIVTLATLLAVLVAFVPWAAVMFVLLVGGYIVGSFLAGDMRGVAAIVPGGAIALAIAGVLNLPYLVGFDDWHRFGTASSSARTDVALADLLVLQTGPFGSSVLGWAVFGIAFLPVLSGTGARFTWAMRAWGWTLVAWALAWVSARGLLPVGLPVTEILLVPVALGLAVLGGIGAQVIDADVAEARFRRTIPAAIGVIGFCIAMLPLIEGASSGRWGLARTDLETSFGAIVDTTDEVEPGPYRVLWIGHPHVLAAASSPTVNDLAWYTSIEGPADFRALWGSASSPSTDGLAEAVDAGLSGRTSRLGRELSRFGVRYVVVMDQQAPVPEVSRRIAVADTEAAGLSSQLDLVRTGVVNPAVVVYENTAHAPMHAALAPAALDANAVDDAAPALVTREAHDRWIGQVRAERDLYIAWAPLPGWDVTLDGTVVARRSDTEVGLGFDTSSLAGTRDAVLSYETAGNHRVVLILQALGWAALFFVRRWIVGRDRRRSRMIDARAERAS